MSNEFAITSNAIESRPYSSGRTGLSTDFEGWKLDMAISERNFFEQSNDRPGSGGNI